MSAVPAAADIAGSLLRGAIGLYRAVVEACEPGIVAGTSFVDPAASLGTSGSWRLLVQEGATVEAGQPLIELIGDASRLGVAEDYVLGPLGFASGIATRARIFRDAAPAGLSIACGGWKKLPLALKPLLRAGLAVSGILPRLVEGDFVYVGKNAVIMLGGVDAAIKAGVAVGHGPVAVQVKSVEEAVSSVRTGAGIIMVDTADLADLADVHAELTRLGLRQNVRLAFGGGVRLQDLVPAAQAGADAVDVGRAILDAPMLDLRMRVLSKHSEV
jgi:nicotinate-nucleotide pyrophosphorylase (carboxylating)